MNPDTIKALLLYSLAFNYAILIIWFGVFSLAHDAMYRLHSRWFSLSVATGGDRLRSCLNWILTCKINRKLKEGWYGINEGRFC